MAVPKRKVSQARRTSVAPLCGSWKPLALVKCSQCGEYKLPHQVCGNCGYYKGKGNREKEA